jgi:hypothetical protein
MFAEGTVVIDHFYHHSRKESFLDSIEVIDLHSSTVEIEHHSVCKMIKHLSHSIKEELMEGHNFTEKCCLHSTKVSLDCVSDDGIVYKYEVVRTSDCKGIHYLKTQSVDATLDSMIFQGLIWYPSMKMMDLGP